MVKLFVRKRVIKIFYVNHIFILTYCANAGIDGSLTNTRQPSIGLDDAIIAIDCVNDRAKWQFQSAVLESTACLQDDTIE